MSEQRTAPPGYCTNTAALVHLIRHGPSVMPLTRWAVLVYHAERATSYGKWSDTHSQDQAMDGSYSYKIQRRTGGYGAWVRGKCGVSLAQYKRENKVLQAAGLITADRRYGRGKDAVTEYAPVWLRIRDVLEGHELGRPEPKPKPLFQPLNRPLENSGNLALPEPGKTVENSVNLALPEPEPGSPRAGTWLSQSRNLALPEPHSGECSGVNSGVSEWSASDGTESPPADDSPTHPLSWEEEKQKASLREISDVLEGVMERPLFLNDRVPAELWAIAARIGVPLQALCRWIQESSREVKSRPGYRITSPILFTTMAGTDLLLWAKTNGELIDQIWRQEHQEYISQRWRRSPVAEMPAEPVFSVCENCGQEAVFNGICDGKECFIRRQRERAVGRRAASG